MRTRHPLSGVWPPLSDDEAAALRQSMADGFDAAHPIVLLNDQVLDGWHRYQAALEAGVEPLLRAYIGDDPAGYVIAAHVARRHLTPGGRAEAVVRCREWRPVAGRPPMEPEIGSSDPIIPISRPSSEPDMAREAQVSVPTIKRAKARVRAEKTPHVAHATGTPEWNTPAPILEAARLAMDVAQFDLDPASNRAAQKIVQARRYLTAADDGLSRDTPWMPEFGEWDGTVWLNPPYDAGLCAGFAARLLAELDVETVRAAVWLSNNATETKWAAGLLATAEFACFPTGRVRFLDSDMVERLAPLQGQMILGFGDVPRFREAFEPRGPVL